MVSGAMFAPPAPLIPRVPTGRSLRLLDINPIELARQLTILESGRYNRCRPGEFLDCAWSSPDGDTRSPNLKWSIFSSNRVHSSIETTLTLQMAGWVTETILMHNDAKRRAATMKLWIQTATVSPCLTSSLTPSGMPTAKQLLIHGGVHRRCERSAD